MKILKYLILFIGSLYYSQTVNDNAKKNYYQKLIKDKFVTMEVYKGNKLSQKYSYDKKNNKVILYDDSYKQEIPNFLYKEYKLDSLYRIEEENVIAKNDSISKQNITYTNKKYEYHENYTVVNYLNKDSNPYMKEYTFYDDTSRIKESILFSSLVLQKRTTYLYDAKKNKIISETQTFTHPRQTSTNYNGVDKYGYAISYSAILKVQVSMDKNQEIKSGKFFYENQYDSKGNLIKIFSKSKDGKKELIEERKIMYE
ncbi:hypothetical protein J2799_003005 [Chryseobacterium vietnamense]|uniref:hypothetical protein n=1 Tax=Chryseobacterium vietnamense TaxID=866785 RepID=UPI002862B639|nr:hypothetical protein [Chryseobacterium vietnamense]MDR6488487.1 hypothetical protein [Chryseobacterium vietnamense]